MAGKHREVGHAPSDAGSQQASAFILCWDSRVVLRTGGSLTSSQEIRPGEKGELAALTHEKAEEHGHTRRLHQDALQMDAAGVYGQTQRETLSGQMLSDPLLQLTRRQVIVCGLIRDTN